MSSNRRTLLERGGKGGKIMSEEINVSENRLNQNAASVEKLGELLKNSKSESNQTISTREFLLQLGITDEWLKDSLEATKKVKKAFVKFRVKFGIQAITCSVADDEIVQLIMAVFEESAIIANKIATLQDSISSDQAELFMTTNRLHEYLMDRKFGKPTKQTVTSTAVEKMFQMWKIFPATTADIISMMP